MTRKKERFTFSEEQRVEPAPCPVFGECGGCKFQDVEYSLQVQAKAQWLSGLFERQIEVRPSPKGYGYRNRMDFVVAFGNHVS